jgi:hypothetical protein
VTKCVDYSFDETDPESSEPTLVAFSAFTALLLLPFACNWGSAKNDCCSDNDICAVPWRVVGQQTDFLLLAYYIVEML